MSMKYVTVIQECCTKGGTRAEGVSTALMDGSLEVEPSHTSL